MAARPTRRRTVDPGILRSVSRAGGIAHIAFLALMVLNPVGGFTDLARVTAAPSQGLNGDLFTVAA